MLNGSTRSVHDVHGTVGGCEVAIMHGADVGVFDGLTKGVINAQGLVQGLHMTYMSQETQAK